MLVMGGIVGSGIFINPYVVAGLVHTPALILGAWLVGGAIALAGAFIYAEGNMRTFARLTIRCWDFCTGGSACW
jgi:basic amino acid/polyamine antiporter, APA family